MRLGRGFIIRIIRRPPLGRESPRQFEEPSILKTCRSSARCPRALIIAGVLLRDPKES
jgi:hypothetical protein